MDVKRQKKAPAWRNRKFIITTGAVLIAIISLWKLPQNNIGYKVAKEEVWLGTVMTGDLQLQVEGFGKLQSKHTRLLTAGVRGIIQEILLKPGAIVTKDSTILRLSNPDIDQQVVNEEILLGEVKANLRQATVNHERELLAQQANLAALEAEYGTASFNLQATTRLIGKGIVSQLDHKRAQLETEQLKKRFTIEKRRLEQLSVVHTEAINILQDKINQQRGKLNAALNKQKELNVNANIDGVLQRLPVELGQSVPAGDVLAFVGGTDALIAEINVSQSQVDQIQIGQRVDISTRGDNAQGEVIRIDPVVTSGTVMIEVDINGALPSNARPDLTVDATIHAGSLTNVHYIERPVNTQPGATATLYRLNPEQDTAQATQVTFGEEAGQYIQITRGANRGDRFILSDTVQWQQTESIILI
jgi:multidrug resistance efflux pump